MRICKEELSAYRVQGQCMLPVIVYTDAETSFSPKQSAGRAAGCYSSFS